MTNSRSQSDRILVFKAVGAGLGAGLLASVPVAFHLWTALARGDLAAGSLTLLITLYLGVVVGVAVLATVLRADPIRIDPDAASEPVSRPDPVHHPWAALRFALHRGHAHPSPRR